MMKYSSICKLRLVLPRVYWDSFVGKPSIQKQSYNYIKTSDRCQIFTETPVENMPVESRMQRNSDDSDKIISSPYPKVIPFAKQYIMGNFPLQPKEWNLT